MREWKGYTHGVNLGGWLSQCEHNIDHYEDFIKEEDIERISSWGLDHVRVPVDYEVAEEVPLYIDRCAEWCGRHGLNMILDLHKTYGFSFDGGEGESGFFEIEEYQERFYRLWMSLAERYKDLGDRIAFELLNEITDKEYSDIWNRISLECVRRVRSIAPETKIIIGGYYNNSIDALADLALPYDENIVYTFHCYEPLIFTHQGAYWVPKMDTSFRIPVNASYKVMKDETSKLMSQISVGFDGFDPDASLSEEYFERHFGGAVSIAEERNVLLYCGEYGVIDLADPDDTLAWYGMIGKAFDKYKIGRAAWNYKEKDFGLIDDHMKPALDELIKRL